MPYFVGFGGTVTISNTSSRALTFTVVDVADAAVEVYDDEERSSAITQPGAIAANDSVTVYFMNNTLATVEVSLNGAVVDSRDISVENGQGYNYAVAVELDDYSLSVDSKDIEIVGSANGLILHSPDGTRWRIGVDDLGAVAATEIV